MKSIPRHIFLSIKKHATEEMPNECCGFVVNHAESTVIIKGENIAEDKTNNFCISPYSYLKAVKTGNIIYSYHSHTQEQHSNDFTLIDIVNSVEHRIPMILYDAPRNKFLVFSDNKVNDKYIGTPFQYNKHDCLSLVEKFYLNEFNLKLPIYERDSKTLSNNPNLMLENILSYGFVELDAQSPIKYGDVFITEGMFGPSHLMIYIGDNQILHHGYMQYSTVNQYTDAIKRNIVKITRHKSLC